MSSLSNCPAVKSCSETAANKLCSQFLELKLGGSGVGGGQQLKYAEDGRATWKELVYNILSLAV